MNFLNKAAAVAKSAATATADAATKAYNDLSSLPSSITCSNVACKTVLAVPPEVWHWTCAACQAVNAAGSACAQCKAAKTGTARDAPKIACGVCSTVTPVPSSVAAQYANSAAVGVQKAANDAVVYTKTTYNEMVSRPDVVACSNRECKTLLSVPAELWSWPCANGHMNSPDIKVCATEACGDKRTNFSGPTIACPNCEAHTIVAGTVAQIKLAEAAQSSKEFAKATATSAKAQYTHWVSKPEEFNCKHCNAKLMVPTPAIWMCQKEGCSTQNNPDQEKCAGCATKYDPKVMCGSCNNVTTVPENNLLNSVRSTHLSGKAAFNDAKKAAGVVKDNQDEIKAAGQFAAENPELAKAAAGAATNA